MTTMEFELIDAALNAPTGLDGLAADVADLAGRKPTNGRHTYPSNPAAPYAIHAAARRIGTSPASARNHGCR